MINVKYRIEHFPVYDYRGVEKHLSAMAAKGWQIEDMERICWKYRRIEPKKMTYAVTYVFGASEFNPHPTEEQESLKEYCEEAGWTKAADWNEMQVFCTERTNPIPIETDETVRMNLIHRFMRRRFFLIGIPYLFIILMQLWDYWNRLNQEPIQYLTTPSSILVILSQIIVLAIWGVNWGSYILWFWRSKYLVARGKECARTYCYRIFNKISIVGMIIVLIPWSIFVCRTRSSAELIYMGLILVGFIIMLILVHKFRQGMKRNGFSKGENITWTTIAIIVLYFLLLGIFVTFDFGLDLSESSKTGEYTASIMEHDRPKEEFPVIVQDFMEVDFWKYSYYRIKRESFMLKLTIVDQDIKSSEYEVPILQYRIIEVKFPRLYNWILSKCFNIEEENSKSSYEKEDDRFWNADAVYRLSNGGDGDSEFQWILCKGNYIVQIYTSWELTEEQKEIIAQNIYESSGIDDSV